MWQCSGAVTPSGRQNWWLVGGWWDGSPGCGSPPHASSTASSWFPYLLPSRTFYMPSGRGRSLISWLLLLLFSGSVVSDPLWPYCLQHSRFPYLSLSPAAAAAKSLQSCPTLCDPIDCSPPGSPVPGILQARTLEWVAISFSNAWKWKVKVKSLSCFQLLATPWTAAHQAPPSMGFSRQEYWSGVPLPSPKEKTSTVQTTQYILQVHKAL